ncbi:MAG: aminotransferase class V-fold PLP-dependent enzyme, partial [Fidelibacterota bacterium]
MKNRGTRLKLFIPGPTHVDEEVLEAMSSYPVGHRSAEFSKLYDDVVTGVRRVLFTRKKVYLGTCSATGLMEAAVRNSVEKRCANFVCGAFSQRWHEITRACGLSSDAFSVEPGQAIKPELVRNVLGKGIYDAVTVVHNETSTGVTHDLEAIARAFHS